MTQARNSASDQPTFRVRATFAPLTHLEVISFEPSRFEQELEDKSQQAPMFFRESPLVLSLERLAEPDLEIDFAHLLDICHRMSKIGRALCRERVVSAVVAGAIYR